MPLQSPYTSEPLQNSSPDQKAFWRISRLVIIVDPVVVIPDMLSKKASTKDKSRLESKNGKHPKIAIPSHDKVVRRKKLLQI
ncbi:MAG: hypothetical protein CM1200mP5_6700 [Candidatus Pelagibacterales bacterium]|nr:MAG: hypothetical protein CM1200mP5_6700 [Pelagibacterales bacterium]